MSGKEEQEDSDERGLDDTEGRSFVFLYGDNQMKLTPGQAMGVSKYFESLLDASDANEQVICEIQTLESDHFYIPPQDAFSITTACLLLFSQFMMYADECYPVVKPVQYLNFWECMPKSISVDLKNFRAKYGLHGLHLLILFASYYQLERLLDYASGYFILLCLTDDGFQRSIHSWKVGTELMSKRSGPSIEHLHENKKLKKT